MMNRRQAVTCGAALVSAFVTSVVRSLGAADPRVQDLVDAGKIRAGIGLTPLALTKDPATGDVRGVALDLGRALAARIGVEFHPVIYPRPGAVIEGLKAQEWDVAISLGLDPNRAAEVDFTPPYMEVDLTGLVPAGSAIVRIADADRAGVRVAVPRGDLVDLLLSRQLKQAELVRADTVIGAFEFLRAGRADVSALPRPNLLQYASQLAGSRVLSDRFGVNSVAIAVPKGNPGRLAYVTEFIEQAKASGLVQRAIENAGLRGVQVAPAATN